MTDRKGRYLRPFELDPTTAEFLPEPAQPPPAAVPPPATAAPPRGSSRVWGRLAWGGILAALAAVAIDTVDRLAARIETDPLTGWPLAVLIAMVGVAAVTLLGRELIQLRRLQHRASLRDEGLRLAASDLHGRAPALVDEITHGLPVDPRVGEAIANYRRQGDDALADGERMRLFERNVLVPLDDRAYRLVLESARDIGLLTAISPYGLLDGLLVIWRTTLMVRAVARLYGIAPGPVATMALMRRCLRNAALAGLADVATHAMLEHAGASIAAMLSARAGQGAGNALLAAKLGIEAIRESRPLPFVEAAPPTLRQIRKSLLNGDRNARRTPDDERP
jgi:putative membrane protein